MLLSETSYNVTKAIEANNNINDVIKAIAKRLAADSTRYSSKFSVRDEQNNVVITIIREGSAITVYVNNTLICKGDASDNAVKDAKNIYSCVNSALHDEEVDDPLDAIADSINAEEAENKNVNHNYPAYMR